MSLTEGSSPEAKYGSFKIVKVYSSGTSPQASFEEDLCLSSKGMRAGLFTHEWICSIKSFHLLLIWCLTAERILSDLGKMKTALTAKGG